MTTYTNIPDKFFTDGHTSMNRELADNVIAQYGGEDAFLASYADVCDNGLDSIETTQTPFDFFTDNKAAIVEFAKAFAKSIGDGNAIDLISSLNGLRNEYKADEVAEALYDDHASEHQAVAVVVAAFVAEELAVSYNDFIENQY